MTRRVVFVFLCLLAPGLTEVQLDATKFDTEVFPVYQSLAVRYDSVTEINQYLEGMHELNWLTKRIFGINDTAFKNENPVTFHNYVKDLANLLSKPMENPLLYQGDIVLTLDQLDDLIEDAKTQLAEKEGNPHVRAKRTLTSNDATWWNHFPIPYYIGPGVDRYLVQYALKMWTDNTCITFEENPYAMDAIVFVYGQYCNSQVGKTGGKQKIELGNGCYVPGIIAHEIGHALGLYHEQARYDRDDYINIDWYNINPEMLLNYGKFTANEMFTFGVPYDFGSLMHYDAFSFRLFYRPSITTKDVNFLHTIGQRQSIAFSDFKKVHHAYCEHRCTEGKMQCLNGGYGCKETGCRCPEGFTGNQCQLLEPSSNYCQPATLTAEVAPKVLQERGAIHCYHWITATPGQLIELTIDYLNFNQQDVCSQSYLEIKYSDDMSVAGARLCNFILQRKIISATNNVMIIYKGLYTSNTFSLSYQMWNPELVTAPMLPFTETPTFTPAPGFTPLWRVTPPLVPKTSTKVPAHTTEYRTTPGIITTTTVTPFIMPSISTSGWTQPVTDPTLPKTLTMTLETTTPSTTTTTTSTTTTTPTTTTTSTYPTTTTTPAATTTQPATTTTIPSPTPIPPPQPNGTILPCQIPYFLPYPYPLPYPIPYPYPYSIPYPYPHPNFTQPFPYGPNPVDGTEVEKEEFIPLQNTTVRPMPKRLSHSATKITISAVNVSWPYTACEELQANATIPYKNSDSIIVGDALGSALTSCIKSSMAKVGEQKFKADLLGEELPGMKYHIELAINVDFTDFLDHMYF